MCKWCYEHSSKPWYLHKKYHDIRNAPVWLQMVNNMMMKFLGPFVEDTVDSLAEKVTPYEGMERLLYDFFTRHVLGAQTVSNLDEALEIINTAHDVYLHRCNCMRSTHPNHPEVFRCIFLNHSADYARRNMPNTGILNDPHTGKFVDLEVAKEIIIRERQNGHFTQVMFSPRPYVECICNCDQFCARWKVPELPWGNTPSFKISEATEPDRCDDCGTCLKVCYSKAISIFEDREGHHVVVNQDKCIGCGLCTEHCPKGVFELKPRKKFWDPVVLKVIERSLQADGILE